MIFPVNVHLHDHEDILQDKFAEIRQVMAFPVLNTGLEVCYRLCIFGSSLRLVDPSGDPLDNFDTFFELVIIRIVLFGSSFQEFL